MRMFRRASTAPMPDRLATRGSVRGHGGGGVVRLAGGADRFAEGGARSAGADAGRSGDEVTLPTGAGVTEGPGEEAAGGNDVGAGPMPFRQFW